MKYEGVCIAVKNVNLSKKFYQDLTKPCYGINIRSVYLYANREERAFINMQSGKI